MNPIPIRQILHLCSPRAQEAIPVCVCPISLKTPAGGSLEHACPEGCEDIRGPIPESVDT